MKTISLILLFTLGMSEAHSQDYDSLKQKILKMDVAINAMHHNMVKAHKQFRTGTAIVLAGAVLTAVGAFIVSDQAGDLNNNADNLQLLYLGSGVMTVGVIIQMDSHKWLGYGGRRRE